MWRKAAVWARGGGRRRGIRLRRLVLRFAMGFVVLGICFLWLLELGSRVAPLFWRSSRSTTNPLWMWGDCFFGAWVCAFEVSVGSFLRQLGCWVGVFGVCFLSEVVVCTRVLGKRCLAELYDDWTGRPRLCDVGEADSSDIRTSAWWWLMECRIRSV